MVSVGKVVTLVSERLSPGNYEMWWDGTCVGGTDVSSGVYIVRMISSVENGDGFSATRKVVLMR
jgi:hypothetical protein